MRWDTPLQMFERWVLEDIEVTGSRSRAGPRWRCCSARPTATRRCFDDPDRLDLARAGNPHISFGAGIHFCLGAPLARIELIESFGALLERAPKLELVSEPEWKPGYVIRGLKSLDLTIG